ncbi:MAG: DUF805 domain-containing protein [Asticcacaulis sp.]
MSSVPLMFQPLVKYAVFEGRSRRSEFWLWVLFRFLLHRAVGIVAMMFMAPAMTQLMQAATNSEAMKDHPEQFMQTVMPAYLHMVFGFMPLLSLISLALLLPSLAVGVRRLHDIGRTGWWIVMPYGVLIVGLIVWATIGGASLVNLIMTHPNGGTPTDAEGVKFVLSIAGGLFVCVLLPQAIAWIVMLVFFVTEGKRGPNRFGPDPKGEALNDTP